MLYGYGDQMKLYEHQINALNETEKFNKCAYFLEMGLGKTFVGSEKAVSFNQDILVICQKSKVQDWVEHFEKYYETDEIGVYDLTKPKQLDAFLHRPDTAYWSIAVINYDLVWRRKIPMKNFTLMLDESSLIQNKSSKRTRSIMRLKPDNVILLSGTPTDGKYERLWTQCKLLGWDISEKNFWDEYVKWRYVDFGGIMVKQVYGYKHVAELKANLRAYGCIFMKTDEAICLPDQVNQIVRSDATSDYRKFMKNSYLLLDDGTQFVGDNSLSKLLYSRQLCSIYNPNKLSAFLDIVNSTSERLIVFYNFNAEFELMMSRVDRPVSVVNGHMKDLSNYENHDDSITFVQYQAGAYGLNLQKANHIIYFSLPLSSEQFEQSKKRIHRIGQNKTCFYYVMMCKNSVEEKIYAALQEKKDYTDRLFEKSCLQKHEHVL